MSKIYTVILLVAIMFVNGCSKSKKPLALNPELLGQWQSNGGCQLYLASPDNKMLKLDYFIDDRGVRIDNQDVKFYKESIMTKLKTANNPATGKPFFAAYFLEGRIIVDSGCNDPLGKVN